MAYSVRPRQSLHFNFAKFFTIEGNSHIFLRLEHWLSFFFSEEVGRGIFQPTSLTFPDTCKRCPILNTSPHLSCIHSFNKYLLLAFHTAFWHTMRANITQSMPQRILEAATTNRFMLIKVKLQWRCVLEEELQGTVNTLSRWVWFTVGDEERYPLTSKDFRRHVSICLPGHNNHVLNE